VAGPLSDALSFAVGLSEGLRCAKGISWAVLGCSGSGPCSEASRGLRAAGCVLSGLPPGGPLFSPASLESRPAPVPSLRALLRGTQSSSKRRALQCTHAHAGSQAPRAEGKLGAGHLSSPSIKSTAEQRAMEETTNSHLSSNHGRDEEQHLVRMEKMGNRHLCPHNVEWDLTASSCTTKRTSHRRHAFGVSCRGPYGPLAEVGSSW
jgi:hypothetical protein